MAQATGISWTDHTFNIAWGCEKISPGCANCYADTLSHRYWFNVWGPNKNRRTFGSKHWREPLKWNADAAKAGVRRRVFCSSMTDWCLDDPAIIAEVKNLFPLIQSTPWLDWQLLTKRPENICNTHPVRLPGDWPYPSGYPNVWMGVSIESMDYAWRADVLREVPCSVRFISYEPALGPLAGINLDRIDWLIFGGESGPNFRPMQMQWARDIRDQCKAAGVAFWFKQSAGRRPGTGVELDGRIEQSFPLDVLHGA